MTGGSGNNREQMRERPQAANGSGLDADARRHQERQGREARVEILTDEPTWDRIIGPLRRRI